MASIPDKDGMEAIFFMTCKGIMEKIDLALDSQQGRFLTT